MQRTAITVNYLQMLCLLVVLFFFLRRVALIAGVLLSLKSLLWLLGYCFLRRVCFVCWGACLFVFFEELLCMLCYLLLASSKVYFACGVAWLVERWSLVSCFSIFYKYTKYIWITFQDSILQALVAGIFSLWAPVRTWVCCGATVLRCCQCNWGPSLTRGNCIGLQCGSATNTRIQ